MEELKEIVQNVKGWHPAVVCENVYRWMIVRDNDQFFEAITYVLSLPMTEITRLVIIEMMRYRGFILNGCDLIREQIVEFAKKRDSEMMIFFLEFEVNVNFVVTLEPLTLHVTPLQLAVIQQLQDVVEYLLDKRNADINFSKNPTEYSAIHMAARNESTSISHILIQRNANVLAKDLLGRTPMMWAAEGNRCKQIEKLLLYNGSLHDVDLHGRTMLHMVVLNSRMINTTILSFLILMGLDPNAQDEDGCNALHILLLNRYCKNTKEAVEVLKTYGVNLSQQNKFGQTALHLAVGKRITFIAFLLNTGVDPNAFDEDNLTFVDCIKNRKKRTRIISFLIHKEDSGKIQLSDNFKNSLMKYNGYSED